jgi:hypothetical protein
MVEYGDDGLLADSHNLKGENFCQLQDVYDLICGPVARVPGYKSRGQGSIHGTTRISEK